MLGVVVGRSWLALGGSPAGSSSPEIIVTEASGVSSGGAFPPTGLPETGRFDLTGLSSLVLDKMLARAELTRRDPVFEPDREKVAARFMLLAASSTYA
jgi:hypothetical protein